MKISHFYYKHVEKIHPVFMFFFNTPIFNVLLLNDFVRATSLFVMIMLLNVKTFLFRIVFMGNNFKISKK